MNIMTRSLLKSEFIWWIIFGIVALYFTYPLRKHLKFGIDLVGGTYITLEVQTQKAIEDEFSRMAHNLSDRLKEAGIPAPVSVKVNPDSLVVHFDTVQEAQDAAAYFKKQESNTKQQVDEKVLTIRFPASEEERIKRWAVQSNVEVLDSRLRRLAVEEIMIAQKGEKEIIVELPDVDDPQQAKAMIGKPAVLEFKIVEKTAHSENEILDEFDGQLPEDMMIVAGRDEGRDFGKEFYLVSTYADLTGKDLKEAKPGFGGKTGSQLVVHFQMTNEGARKFYELTSKNVGRRMAAILDGSVITAPVINEPISNSGVITGRFVGKEASELAALLKSGAFVAPVTFEKDRHIGPTLGAESIRAGLVACLIGLIALLIFGILFYKVAGIFAFVALLYNIVLLLFFLSRLKATLTLPGIAGIVLTVGMAIDASVLIFEKIREELATGVSFRNAFKSGFSGALSVILDSNITTFIVGVVLYQFGTGPIQGFAVTMMLGIITTLISGLFFLRSLFYFVFDTLGIQNIKI